MKPWPFSDELFYWIAKSGGTLVTLSINTVDCSLAYLEQLKDFFALAQKHGIKVAVDLSTGFPGEDIRNLDGMVGFLETQEAETIGVNAFYRIYPGTGLYRVVNNNAMWEKNLIGWQKGGDYVKPVFFNCFAEAQIMEVIGNKPKFRLEGFEKASNYQRVKGQG